jgi:hypothetical protein
MPVESVQENQEAMKPLQGDPLPPRTVSPSVTQNKEKFEYFAKLKQKLVSHTLYVCGCNMISEERPAIEIGINAETLQAVVSLEFTLTIRPSQQELFGPHLQRHKKVMNCDPLFLS